MSDYNTTILSLEPGDSLSGRYRLERVIGEGGMAVVWLATDLNLDRPVAIKVLPTALSRDVRAITRLKAEAIRNLELTHPNIVRLYGFEQDPVRGNQAYLVMQYVEGGTLHEILAEYPNGLPKEELEKWSKEIASAVDFAHERGVLHRDIKPSNIIVEDATGTAYLMDFGIARETRDTMTMVTGRQESSGTLPYMSPQQLVGKNDKSNDIYSFAATLYETLCGHPPFHTGEIAYQIREIEPEPIESLSKTANAALLAGLAKEPKDRPATTAALVAMFIRVSDSVRSSKIGLVAEVLSEVLQAAAGLEDKFWKTSTLSKIATAQAETGDIAGALQTAAGIMVDKKASKVATLSAIAAAQVKARDIAGARSTISRALQDVAEIENDKVSKAFALSTIAAAQVKVGDIAGARSAVSKVLQDITEIEDDATFVKSEALSSIAATQANVGDIAGALQTAAGIWDGIDKALALSKIATAQAMTGDIAGALQTVAENKTEHFRVRALSTVAAAQAKAGNKAEARLTFLMALQIVAGIEDDMHKAVALSDIAAVQAEAGDVVGALQTAGGIEEEDYLKTKALSDIAAAQAMTGDIVGARSTISKALQVAAEIECDKGSIAIALSEIATAQVKARDIAGARSTVSKALQNIARLENGDIIKEIALSSIAAVQVKAGDIVGALQSALMVNDGKIKACALFDIGAAQTDTGDIARACSTVSMALQVAVGIKDDGQKAMALSDIMDMVSRDLAETLNEARVIFHNEYKSR